VLRTIPVPNYPSGLAADDRATWVVYVLPGGESQGSAAAAVIDARFNDVTQTVELNRSFGGSDGIVLAAGSAWVADPGFVTRIDEESGKVQALIPVGLSGETDVIFDGAAIWAIGGSGIVRIDQASAAEASRSGPASEARSPGSTRRRTPSSPRSPSAMSRSRSRPTTQRSGSPTGPISRSRRSILERTA
jgi:DNA-binding beta-propeller fold protein YncE